MLLKSLPAISLIALSQPLFAEEALQILYTGDLFGYARERNEQRLCDKSQGSIPLYKPCSQVDKSPAARTLHDLIDKRRSLDVPTLTVGMGDNFAMNYLSRVVVVEEGPLKHLRYIPKDELTYDDESQGWRDLEGLRETVALDPSDDDARELLRKLTVRTNETAGNLACPDRADLSSDCFDNVAHFFVSTGYDALVPGKHDFYYGPGRLQEISEYLSRRGVEMLGANLVIRTTERNPAARRHESIREKERSYWIKDMDFERRGDGAVVPGKFEEVKQQPMSWKLPTQVTPWIRRFVLANGFVNGTDAFESSATLHLLGEGDLDQDLASCRAGSEGCWELGRVSPRNKASKDPSAVEFLRKTSGTLVPGSTYALCVRRCGHSKSLCRTFNVETPLFGHQVEQPFLRLTHEGLPGETVVLGAVQMGLEKLVGELNSSWVRQREASSEKQSAQIDPRFSTRMRTIDPASAVLQQVDYCRNTGACTSDTRFVLLAHMPRAEAQVLSKKLSENGVTLSLVISQADNSSALEPGSEVSFVRHSGVVATPRESFKARENPNEGRPPKVDLGVAWVGAQSGSILLDSVRGECDGCQKSTWMPEGSLTRSHSPQLLLGQAWAALTDQFADSKEVRRPGGAAAAAANNQARSKRLRVTSKEFRLLALYSMRSATKADVALMQRRDVYDNFFPDNVAWWPAGQVHEHERFESVLERLLWKGDFVVKRTITGAALKAALAESKRFERAQADPYTLAEESDRQLIHLGLSQEPVSKTWYVNGSPVEDKVLYSVAVTDFLAYGDTGYTQFQAPAAPPDPPLANLKGLLRLSEQMHYTVCALAGLNVPQRIPSTTRGASNRLQAMCRNRKRSPTRVRPADYMQISKNRPFKQAPKADFGDQVRQAFKEGMDRFPKLNSSAERIGHQRRYWRLIFDKGEIAVSSYDNSLERQSDAAKRFPGVSNGDVNRRASRTWGPALQFELRRVWARSHAFSRAEFAFSDERTLRDEPVPERDDSGDDRFLSNLKANSWRTEVGLRRPFAGTNRKLGWLGWLGSIEFSGQLAEPLNSFKLNLAPEDPSVNQDPSGTVTVEGRTPRTTRYLGKSGLRWEGKRSWAETGGFYGVVRRPTAFRVLSDRLEHGGAPCPPAQVLDDGTTESVGQCLLRTNVLRIGTTAAEARIPIDSGGSRERGFFANANYRLTLPKNWPVNQLVFEQRLQFFFNGNQDNASDTRYLETISVGPTFAILRGLSLKPTYSLTMFKNRILGNQFLGRAFDVKLEYRLDWRTGSNAKQVFKYGRP